ncbi:MAG: tetratricopeptide repeat protein [Desulfatitalea sp.]
MVYRYLLTVVTIIAIAAFATEDGAADSAKEELPVSVRSVLAEVGRLMDQKAYDHAIDQLTAFQARGKSSPEAGGAANEFHHPMIYFALGNCYLLQGKNALAQKAFSQVVEQRPEMLSAWLNLAKACYDGGRYEEAGRHFAEAYDRATEKKTEHLYFSAAAYLMAQKYPPAIAAFERLFQAHPNQVQPLWKEHWVHALLAGGQTQRALPAIKELITLHTGDERVRWQEILIQQYMQLRMHAEARAYVAALTRQEPALARWWKMLGQIQLSAGQDAEALAALTIYGYLTPLSAEEKKLWADLSLQANVPCQSVPVYKALLEDKPDRQVLKNLVIAYQKLGDGETALKMLDRFGTLDKDPELLMFRADLLYGLKRYAEASKAYRRAAQESHPRTGQAWLMAGYAAWQADDLTTSRQAFARAVGFEGQRKTAMMALKQLEKIN